MSWRTVCWVAIAAWLTLASVPAQSSATAVEFFHAAFDHYFITADVAEIALLEDGAIPGWTKTGYAFSVATDGSTENVPVCRFFSVAFAPKSTHFYTPYKSECEQLKAGSAWAYESVAFYLRLPSDSGTCPAGTAAIYRLYNNGMGGAPNHRYTGSPQVLDAMLSQGWIAEGSAATRVFACGPATPSGTSANTVVYSSKMGRGYDVSIYVPNDYDSNSAPLPVVYALDAQVRLSSLIEALRQRNPKVIVVQIYDMGLHLIDYTMPGAVDYLAFMTNDLLPYVEANYRVNTRKRAVSGLASSANFPFHALYLESPGKWSFAHYWMTNGSFRQQQENINTEEQKLFEAMGASPFPVSLVFARGATEFGPLTKELYDKIAARGYRGIHLYDVSYPLGRIETDVPAFFDALEILCGQPNCRGMPAKGSD